jgi:hypothetical protein
MQTIINTLHSYNRYLLMIAMAFVLIRAFSGWLGKKNYEKLDNTGAVALVGLAHLQLVLGLIQYFVTSAYTTTAFANMKAAMKDTWLRYFAVEHIAMMILAVLFIQLGRTFSKKAIGSEAKHKKMAIYTSIALLLILAALVPKGLLFSSMASLTPAQ